MISYWERHFLKYDFVVVGAGLVGINTAINLKNKHPKAKIAILERGFITTGASLRNAGFACMGSVTELLSDIKNGSEEDMLQLFERRKKGLEKLRNRVGDKAMDYASNGSYELISDKEANSIDQLDYLNHLLMPVSKAETFSLADDKIKNFKFNSNYVKHLIQNNLEGELNSSKLIESLCDMAISMGIEIKSGSEVFRFKEEEECVLLQVMCSNQNWMLEAKKCIFCTNAYATQFFKDEEIIPGRGQVLVTEPIPDLPFKGIFHFEEGYYYFREIDGRILFGGGRNLFLEEEKTNVISLNVAIQAELGKKLKEIILPNTPFTVDQRWSGIMAFGPSKSPIIKSFSYRIYGAFRLGGMGVALACEVAENVVELMEETAEN